MSRWWLGRQAGARANTQQRERERAVVNGRGKKPSDDQQAAVATEATAQMFPESVLLALLALASVPPRWPVVVVDGGAPDMPQRRSKACKSVPLFRVPPREVIPRWLVVAARKWGPPTDHSGGQLFMSGLEIRIARLATTTASGHGGDILLNSLARPIVHRQKLDRDGPPLISLQA